MASKAPQPKSAAKPAAKPASKPAAKPSAKPAPKKPAASKSPASKKAAPKKPAASAAKKTPARRTSSNKPTTKKAAAKGKPSTKDPKAATPAAGTDAAKALAVERKKKRIAAKKALLRKIRASKPLKGTRAADLFNKRRVAKIKGKLVDRVVIDCSKPVAHGILDLSSFEKYLHDQYKLSVRTKPGVLRDKLTITREKTRILIISKSTTHPFRKRYLKYLTKKYLKKQQLRDWLRVVSTDPKTYELRYYNIQEAGDDSGSEDED